MYLYVLFVIFIIVVAMICSSLNNTPKTITKEEFASGKKIISNDTKTFMIKDLKTNLWLNTDKNGLARFGASGFGFNFRLSKNAEEFLPLRSANNPNDYLIATTNGTDDFRIVSNPGSNRLKIQIMNLEGRNILGYTNENNVDVFISIDQAGYIKTVTDPNESSIINMMFT
jgi:hypothetical protein